MSRDVRMLIIFALFVSHLRADLGHGPVTAAWSVANAKETVLQQFQRRFVQWQICDTRPGD